MSRLGQQPLSPLDGRYRRFVEPLTDYFSEAALNRARVTVEIEWLITLCAEGVAGTSPLPTNTIKALRQRVQDFGPADIEKLALTEAHTKHDVKAVEYFVRDLLTDLELSSLHELVHFACTSEDINNVSYALVTKSAMEEVWVPRVKALRAALVALARQWRAVPMLARTHGQPATPTTLGKEIAVFAHRLGRILPRVENQVYPAKFSGATGTFSAHVVAEPAINWPVVSKKFVESLGLTWNPLTTQIESHDGVAELMDSVAHVHRVLHNFATDMWTYISLGYITQIPDPKATGSSTMPHKINPIRFENAEANLEIANALLQAMSASLTTSRLQRDLTDSTTQRNIGVAFGHSLIAVENLSAGLGEIAVNSEALANDLRDNPEVLAEAIQTVIRAEIARGESTIADPYAVLKDFTRGHTIDQESLRSFISGLDISPTQKEKLAALTPGDYVGLAADLVDFLDD